jgi:hypothetical protein
LFLSIFLENLFERYFLLGFPFLSSSIRIGYVSPPPSLTLHTQPFICQLGMIFS